MTSQIAKIAAITIAATIVLASLASAGAQFFTAVGGASGMTLQLSPYKPGGIIRGAASKIMDNALQSKNHPATSGVCKQVYCAAQMAADNPIFSEPGAPGTTTRKFTGWNSQCEIDYSKDPGGDGTIRYALIMRADSVLGLRFAVNREKITGFAPLQGSNTFVVNSSQDPVTKVWTDVLPTDPDWTTVLNDINNKLANGGIPIEGGLTECFIDSGVRAVDKWNTQFGGTSAGTQPQINSAHFPNVADPTQRTTDNLLSVAVLLVLYNSSVENGSNKPINFTNQMERLITGGKVDNWDFFFNQDGYHAPLLDFYREPLSGTCITYENLIMRGLPQAQNNTTYTNGGATWGLCGTDSKEYHVSGVPDLNCVQNYTQTCPGNKPGSGTILTAVDYNAGSHGYVFCTKFTPIQFDTTLNRNSLDGVRVGLFNGYSPFDFTYGHQLPGFGGQDDVDSHTDQVFYPNVLDGKYPLWTYNHCFDATNGTSDGLTAFIDQFKLDSNIQNVRASGLIPLADMNSATRRGASKGLGRCGFYSPVTGETVRDGMMFELNDTNGVDIHGNPIQVPPGDSYVEMRP